LIKKVNEITEIRRNGSKIDEIRVYLGGDIIEGEDIFPHQAHLIDNNLFTQAVKDGPAVIASCIIRLLETFQKVRVVCVPGNHGRNGPKSSRSHPKTNWDNVCYAVTKLIIMGPGDSPRPDIVDRIEFIEPHEDHNWYAVDDVLGWGCLMVHGHEIKGGFAGYPWYGAGRRSAGWIDTIPDPWDYLYVGHFHTYAGPVMFNHRTMLANGTVESNNEYAAANMASCGYPCQRLNFFNKKYGLISDHQIFISDRKSSRMRAEQWDS